MSIHRPWFVKGLCLAKSDILNQYKMAVLGCRKRAQDRCAVEFEKVLLFCHQGPAAEINFLIQKQKVKML